MCWLIAPNPQRGLWIVKYEIGFEMGNCKLVDFKKKYKESETSQAPSGVWGPGFLAQKKRTAPNAVP
jgi:hypothetical protein